MTARFRGHVDDALPGMANPTQCDESLTVVEPERRIWCRRYEACLRWAVSHNWCGFHCGACSVDDEDAPIFDTGARRPVDFG